MQKLNLLIFFKDNPVAQPFLKQVKNILLKIKIKRSLKIWNAILKENVSLEERFNSIYKNRLWGQSESVSGAGSSLAFTENLRNELPKLITKYDIHTIFDAPCGDLNWMKFVLPNLDANYIGGDIVQDLIQQNTKFYGSSKAKFIHINLIEKTFPEADLMICRDCLFHFSYKHIKNFFKNFLDSNIKYLLLTNHTDNYCNKDIKTGEYRFVNFFLTPFYFSKAPLERIEDSINPEPKREMCLWTREQVADAYGKKLFGSETI